MKLYILITDNGDGSYSPHYTLNPDHIKILEKAYNEDRMDYENGFGCDGDGFHYDTINVPDGSSAESLGVPLIPDDDINQFSGEEE